MNKSINQLVSPSQNSVKAYYTSEAQTPFGFLRIHASETAITEIRFFERSLVQEGTKATHKTNKVSELGAKQLREYIAGTRTSFDLPLAPQGTDFQQQVWRQLLNIKYGETASYLDIAKALKKPKACRAVGAANGKNPISIVIPCHRIIGSTGKLTGYAGGLSRKEYLLTLEKAI